MVCRPNRLAAMFTRTLTHDARGQKVDPKFCGNFRGRRFLPPFDDLGNFQPTALQPGDVVFEVA